jgi:hypothetical protein
MELAAGLQPVVLFSDLKDLTATVYPPRGVASFEWTDVLALNPQYLWIHAAAPGGCEVERVAVENVRAGIHFAYAPQKAVPTATGSLVPNTPAEIGDRRLPSKTRAYWDVGAPPGALDPAYAERWQLPIRHPSVFNSPSSVQWDGPIWVPPGYCFLLEVIPTIGLVDHAASIVYRDIAEAQAVESSAP